MAIYDIVTWHKSYSVNIPLIDSQHMELIHITNKLYRNSLTGRNSSKDVFMEVLQGAINYVGYHFSTEEKIMERVNYPAIIAHKNEHNDFVGEVLRVEEGFSKGGKYNPLNLVMYLKDWVLTHIAVSDAALGSYLVKLKHYGALNRIIVKVKTVEGRFVLE